MDTQHLESLTGQAKVLSSFSRALVRETHVLTQRPDLFWQQMHNRLQWEDDFPTNLFGNQGGQGFDGKKQVWLKTRMPFPESEAFVRILSGHSDRVSHCAFSPTGSYLLSASQDGSLRIWDPVTGTEKRLLKNHEGGVNRCAISPDGKTIASAGKDETLKIWNASNGENLHTLTGHQGPITECCFNPDGRILASAGWDGVVILWNPTTGKQIMGLGNQARSTYSPYTFVFNPNGRFIASIMRGTLMVWDTTNGQLIDQTAEAIGQEGGPFAFSPNGRFIAYATRHATISMLDLIKHSEFPHVFSHQQDEVPTPEIGAMSYVTEPSITQCIFSPDGRFLVTGSNLGYLRVWDLLYNQDETLVYRHSREVTSLAFSDDSTFFVSASADHTLKVVVPLSRKESGILTGHSDEVSFSVISPDGAMILSSSSDQTLRLWRVPDKAERFTVQSHLNLVSACTISPDNTFAVSASHDGSLAVWDIEIGKQKALCKGHLGPIEDCTVSPDSRYLVSWSDDLTLRFWDPHTGSQEALLREADLSAIPGQSMGTWSVKKCAVSPDWRYAVTLSAQALHVWDLSTGEKRIRLQKYREQGVGDDFMILPDASAILSVGGGNLAIWDVSSGRPRCLFPGEAPMAITHDWKYVLHCQPDQQTLTLTDLFRGSAMVNLLGHTSRVRACAINWDGSIAVSGSEDGILIFWNVSRAQPYAEIRAHHSHVYQCAFLPDKRSVISIGGDRMMHVWESATGGLLSSLPLLSEGSRFALDDIHPLMIIGDVGGAVYLVELMSC